MYIFINHEGCLKRLINRMFIKYLYNVWSLASAVKVHRNHSLLVRSGKQNKEINTIYTTLKSTEIRR